MVIRSLPPGARVLANRFVRRFQGNPHPAAVPCHAMLARQGRALAPSAFAGCALCGYRGMEWVLMRTWIVEDPVASVLS